jgi:hypothetical protein
MIYGIDGKFSKPPFPAAGILPRIIARKDSNKLNYPVEWFPGRIASR